MTTTQSGRMEPTPGPTAALDFNHALLQSRDQARAQWADGLAKFQARRWLYFNYAYQMVQAALTGQGVVLARLPLVAESLATGDLVEVLPHLLQLLST